MTVWNSISVSELQCKQCKIANFKINVKKIQTPTKDTLPDQA